MSPLISIDWFQVTCLREISRPISVGMSFQGKLENDKRSHNIYNISQPREFNAMFADCFQVNIHDFPVATIYLNPRPSTMAKGLCMVKLANPLLYTARWMWYLQDILDGLSWRYHNITRVDLCADFNFFNNDISPREFIRRYISSADSTEENPSYYRIGSNKFNTVATKKATDNGCTVLCDYIRWGTRNSGVCTYLYNKTQELNDKGGKKYIRDLWFENGLEDTDETPVYRLEFSITPSAMYIQRHLTDEEKDELNQNKAIVRESLKSLQVRELCMDDFCTQSNVQNLFWIYFQHYFRFRIVGTQKMPHNWQEVQLFDIDLNRQDKPYLCHKSKESGVAERNAAKRCAQMLDQEHSLPISDKLALKRASELLLRAADLNITTFDPVALSDSISQVAEGADWQTLERTSGLPREQVEQLKCLVEQMLYHELADLYSIKAINEAVTQRDAEEELAFDKWCTEMAYEREHGIKEVNPDYSKYFDEIERKNKRIMQQFKDERNLPF